jgi:hypothetical protein
MRAPPTQGSVRAPSSLRPLPRTVVLVVLAFAFAGLVMVVTQGGPSYFVQFGQKSTSLPLAHEVLGQDIALPLEDKHDGETFWVLARDPLLRGGEEVAQYLDRPTYRAQRIGYPVLAWPWSLGGEEALLWGLVVTNLVAIGLGSLAAGAIAGDRRSPRALGVYAFAFNPLVWVAYLFDLSDAVALAALLGVLWAVLRGRNGLAGMLSVAAALAKESSLIGLGAAAVLTRGLPMRTRVAMVAPGAIVAGAWKLYVVGRPGFDSDPQLQEFSFVPFGGYLESWRIGWSSSGDWGSMVLTLALVPIAAWIVWLWWRDRGDLLLAAAVPYAAMIPFVSEWVLNIPINAIRAIGPALTLVALYLIASRRSSGRLGGWFDDPQPVPSPTPRAPTSSRTPAAR